MWRRWLGVGLAVLLVACAVGGYFIWQAVKPPSVSAFYEPPSPLEVDEPGVVLTSEAIESEVPGARLWRILYTSTDLDDAVVPISGLVAAPEKAPPPGGYPVVVVAHGTVGITRGCAPSVEPFADVDDQNTAYDFLLGQYVEAGYAVVMSDFQGLGVAGTNSYLVGEVEGRNVLDSARAISDFSEIEVQPGPIISGQSQGGHAALFAGQLAPTYAPDVDVQGVVALAPATDLKAMFTGVLDAGKRGGIVALPVMAADAYAEHYPEIAIRDVLTTRGVGSLNNVIRKLCLIPAILGTHLATPQNLFQPTGLQLLEPYMARNTPKANLDVPVFLGQGDADQVVLPSITRNYEARMCANGTSVTATTYPSVGHFDVIDASTSDVMGWIGDVRAGTLTTSTC